MSLARACFNSLDNLARSSAVSPFPHQPAEHSAWEVHQHNVRTGWRTSFYIQTGLGIFDTLLFWFACASAFVFGPPRKTSLTALRLSQTTLAIR